MTWVELVVSSANLIASQVFHAIIIAELSGNRELVLQSYNTIAQVNIYPRDRGSDSGYALILAAIVM